MEEKRSNKSAFAEGYDAYRQNFVADTRRSSPEVGRRRVTVIFNFYNMLTKFLSFVLIVVFGMGFVVLPLRANAGLSKGNENTPTCMVDAVTARETALISALTTYSTAATAALQARLDGLKDAWSKYNSKAPQPTKDAIRIVVSKYKTAVKDARTALKNSRVKAWSTYNTARLVCGVKFENTNSGLDSTL